MMPFATFRIPSWRMVIIAWRRASSAICASDGRARIIFSSSGDIASVSNIPVRPRVPFGHVGGTPRLVDFGGKRFFEFCLKCLWHGIKFFCDELLELPRYFYGFSGIRTEFPYKSLAYRKHQSGRNEKGLHSHVHKARDNTDGVIRVEG